MSNAKNTTITFKITIFLVGIFSISGQTIASCKLPAYANWNTGLQPGGYGPEWQLETHEAGYPISPWFALPKPTQTMDFEYYSKAIALWRSQNLPITLVSTQWESLLSEPPYLSIEDNSNPNVLPLFGAAKNMVSPFGSEKYWYAVGKSWTSTPLMAKLQDAYPKPPRIIFLSNNEHPKLKWFELEIDRRYIKKPSSEAMISDSTYKQSLIAKRWNILYSALQRGMRDGLTSDIWKDRAIFVGYIATGTGLMGRDSRWQLETITTPENIDPNVHFWDGGSYSYYVESEPTVRRSLPMQAMNWLFMVKENKQINPAYFVDLSVWDGHTYDSKDMRRKQEKKSPGHSLTTYLASVQFATWLLRPQIVREFRFYDETFAENERYTEALLNSLSRINNNPVLRGWWCEGTLVPNPSRPHPYATAIPERYKSENRWFLLNSSADEPLPWRLDTRIRVYAIALTRGSSPNREWLIYAYSADDFNGNVDIEIPGYRKITVQPSRSGDYFLVNEAGRTTSIINSSRPNSPQKIHASPAP